MPEPPNLYRIYRWRSDMPRSEIARDAPLPGYNRGEVEDIMVTPFLVRPPKTSRQEWDGMHLSLAWGHRWFKAINLNHWVCLDHLEEIKGPTRRHQKKGKHHA